MIDLTDKQRKALREFGALKISLKQLSKELGQAIEIDFSPSERKVRFHYDNRVPLIHIELGHVRDVMDRHSRDEISTEELADWAAMLLANPSYEWEGPDEDEIADLLNDISSLTLKPRSE